MIEYDVYTDEGAKQQLGVIADEQQLPKVIGLAMQQMYKMERDRGHVPEMAYTRTLLHMGSTNDRETIQQRNQAKQVCADKVGLDGLLEILSPTPK